MLENIQLLCKEHGISVPNLEKELGFGRGAIYKWDANSPSIDKIEKVANYFEVSIYTILGRNTNSSDESTPTWATAKDKRDFKQILEEDAPIMFDGTPLSDEDKERIKRVMEAMFWDAKEKNKATYGRKNKNKNE